MPRTPRTLDDRMVEQLYLEAMVLADEARSYFDRQGREERDRLAPLGRIEFACESLRVTTRLMHVIAWLLTRRAVSAGEISPEQAAAPERRLGPAPVDAVPVAAGLPDTARGLAEAVGDLHARVARLDATLDGADAPNAAHALLDRLRQSF